jgi:uncharacterized protein (DUF1800 family)
MRLRVAKLGLSLLCVSLACVVPQLRAKKPEATDPGANEQKRAVHALNRLAFGPRPGDVQQVMAMGVDRWIDLQLHPEKISDASMETRLAPLRTLRMSSHEIVEEFPDNQMIRQVMDGKKPMPSDPARRAVFQVQIARMQEKKEERKEEKAEATRTPEAGSRKPNENPSSDANGAMNGTASGPTTGDGEAAQAAKTEQELAAEAAGRPDAKPATSADGNLAPGMSASNDTPSTMSAGDSANSMPSNDSSMTPPADGKAEAKSIPANDPEARRREERLYADLQKQTVVEGLADLSPDQRYKKIMAMSADEKVVFAETLRGGKGQEFLTGLDPKQKETLLAMNNPQGVIVDELMQAKMLRAIYSERQLEEVMSDFWFNHFNVFINKGAERVLLTNYEQDVIRPHALGKFEDLLVATAKSPAMLFYLDNWMSVGPNSMQALGIPERARPYGPYRYPRFPGPNANNRRKNAGLNENYGRELLELHTLSVNGGYSQRDVTEVAKVFTGWTIEKPFEGGGFKYDPRTHEPGPKFVLGHRIKPKGEDEGREVLHMLATSPQTAHFISLKLAQRFIADDPPPALVDRMAKVFLKKKGDIREVLSTLFHSPEFWADSSYRAKLKTPLEFVASAVRATGADVDDAMPLARQLNNMGMPLYGAQPPTGYSMKAETWVSSSALLTRMNFALALTAGRVRGVKVDSAQLAGGPPAPADPSLALSTMETKLLAADVSKQTHDSIVAQTQGQNTQGQNNGPKQKPPDANMIAGLLLGSPEFQRR